MKIKYTLFVLAACCVFRLNAQVIITENFNNPSTLTLSTSGWIIKNQSSPAGLTSWFPGNPGVFQAYSSPDSTYMAANYNSTTNGGTISNWLITPTVTLNNGGILQFATRTNTAAPQSIAPDRLEVYMSVGTGTDVTSSALGTFTAMQVSVNPSLTTSGYPTVWTVFTHTLSNVTGTVTGRFGFRYYVTSAGPTGTNSSYIGLDNVRYELPCPNPTLTVVPSAIGICSGNTLTIGASGASTYTWSSGQNTPSVTVSPMATTVYTLTASSTPNCNSTSTVAITVTLTPSLSVLNVTTCPGTAATLAASGATSYSWSTGSTSATIVDTPTINTTYTVTGFNGICSSSNTVSVAMGTSLNINVVAQPSLICNGKSATIITSGASSYTYSSTSFTSPIHTASLTLNPTANTTYTVNGISGTCLGTNTVFIAVNPAPSVSIASTSNATVCAGSNLTFTVSGANTYSWTSPPTSTNSVFTVITQSTSGNASYQVVGTATNGCSTSTAISRYIDLCTGIETLSGISDNVSVYPNPFTNELRIAGLSSGNIEIYNALGQLLVKVAFNNQTPLNTTELTKGIYILKAFSEENKLASTVKLIKN